MFEYRYKAKCLRVIDGDTYELDVDLGFDLTNRMRLRLRGVDTPETHNQPPLSEQYKAGMLAKVRVQQLIEGKNILMKTEKLKRTFERYVADVLFIGVDGIEYNLADILRQEKLTKEDFLATQYFF